MAIDWSAIEAAGGIGKGTPRALAKRDRRVEADKALRDAYADVDLRDGGYSVVTGRYAIPGHPDPRVRREHHHIKPRSTYPELVAEPRNIVTVTAEEHQLIESGALEIEGADASKELRFHWNRRIVKPGKEPFVIRQHRQKEL